MPTFHPALTPSPASPFRRSPAGRGMAGSVALLLIALPAPALAQAWTTISSAPAGPSVERQVGRIRDDVRDGHKAGQLSRREARDLRRKADGIGLRAGMYAQNGLSDSERSFLESNAAALRSEVVGKRSQGRR